jgi:hypothetical protein
VNKNYLFLGRGFEWNQSHTHTNKTDITIAAVFSSNKNILCQITIDIPIENPMIATGI